MLFANMILSGVCYMRVFYYLFCVELIKLQLKCIENETKVKLDELKESNLNECEIFIRTEIQAIVQMLKKIRTNFHLIHELTYCTNESFGWSNVATILWCFYQILGNLNWVCISYADFSFQLWLGNFSLPIFQTQ